MNIRMQTPSIAGKAIITGASGFIGSRLREVLLDQGVDVIAIRRSGSPEAKLGRSVQLSYDDTEGLAELMAFEKPDYVFHVAGVTKGVTLDDFRWGNVMPTRNLIAAVNKAHPEIKRFVSVSSLVCYGPSTPDTPLVESDPRRPIEYYGQSKLEAELVVQQQCRVPWAIVRPSGVYGPRDVDYFELFKQVHRGVDVYFGNRDFVFSAVHVDDLVSALLVVATHDDAVGKGFFVCDGKPITWHQFQQQIVKASGRKRVLRFDVPRFVVDVAAVAGEWVTKIDKKPRLFNRQKAKMGAQSAWTCRSDALRALGWESVVSVESGVQQTYDWYREAGWM